MRQSIGKGGLHCGLLGSPLRKLSECNCPNQGFNTRSTTKIYGARDADVTPLTVADPAQVWAVRGFYSLYSNQGPMLGLRPLGRWRIRFHIEVLFRKVPAGDDHDFLKVNLVRFRTDIDGNQIKPYDLVKKVGHAGVVLDGIPANVDPTWKIDLTKGPFVFDDYLDIDEESRYCFIGFDALFTENDRSTTGDPDYFLGTSAGIQPYNVTGHGGNGNSDPLNILPGPFFFRPNPWQPPCTPGNWDMPLPPFLQSGAVPVSEGNTGQIMAYLDANYPGWRASRPAWTANFTAQRISLQSLFIWSTSGGANIHFTNKTLTASGAVTYLWNFGDGNTSTAVNPDHAYTASGRYSVTLTATDNSTGVVSVFDQFVDLSLKANFTSAAPRNVVRGGQPVAEVNFTDTSVGFITTWDWNFGDGSAHATTANPIHDYPRGGSFQCTLTVGDGAGNTSSVTKLITT